MEKKQDVIFLHGYKSSRNSTKYHALKADPSLNVGVVEVDFDTVTAEEYIAAFERVAFMMDDPIIVGHSLGGFCARVLSYKYGYRTICYNPSPEPWHTLQGNVVDFADNLIRINDFAYNMVPCIYMLEMGDEVLDHQAFLDRGLYINGEVIKHEGGHHRGEFVHELPGLVHTLANGIF